MKIRFLILAVLFAFVAISQQPKGNLDSMITILPKVKDTAKVNLLVKISILYWNKNNSQSLIYAKNALRIATELNYKKGIAASLSSIGIISMYDNNEKAAITNLVKSIKMYKEIHDTNNVNRVKINLGATYYNNKKYKESIEIFISVLNSSYNSRLGKSILYNNIALNYIEMQEFVKAMAMLNKSILIKQSFNDTVGTAVCFSNLGIVYANIDSIELAKQYYLKARNLHNSVENVFGVAHNDIALAQLFLKENELDKATQNIENAIGKIENNGYMLLLSEAYKILSEVQQAKGNYEKALINYKKSVNYNDSIVNKDSHDELLILQDNYDIKQELIKNQNEEFEKNKQAFLLKIIFIVLLFVIILSFIFYRRYKFKMKSEKSLKLINSQKDKFFSILSHDLRGPFAAFLSLSEVLAHKFEELTQQEVHSYSMKINDSAVMVNSLLENLLDWSVSQTNRREYIFTKIDLKRTVNRSIDLLNYNAENKEIKIINNIDEEIFINGDVNSVKTIFRNLLNNAIKFSNNGGEITISVNSKSNAYEICIADDGVGISSENLNKLFRIDTQYTTAGTQKEKGAGLGLILVKEFVEKNNGTITVESKENIGTTFKFTLKKY